MLLLQPGGNYAYIEYIDVTGPTTVTLTQYASSNVTLCYSYTARNPSSSLEDGCASNTTVAGNVQAMTVYPGLSYPNSTVVYM